MNIKSLFAKLLFGTILLMITGCSQPTMLNLFPVTVPIDLSEKGSIAELEITIKKAENYDFLLLFARPDFDKFYPKGWESKIKVDGGLAKLYPEESKKLKLELGELYKFTGDGSYYAKDGSPSKIGEIVPLRITVYKINKEGKELVSETTYESKAIVGYDNDYNERRVGYQSFEKGRYLIRVENLKGFEFMRGKENRFYFGKFGRKY